AAGLAEILAQHGGGSGVAFAWEMQLLAGMTGGSKVNAVSTNGNIETEQEKLCLELPSSLEARGPVATARPWSNGVMKSRKSEPTPSSNSWTLKTSTCRSSTSRCRR